MHSIIIPTYNEVKRVGNTLNQYYEYFGDNAELILIDNGSTDGTVELLKGFAHNKNNVNLVVFPEPLGKGGAIHEGIKVAHHEMVGFVDADGAIVPTEYQKLLNSMAGGAFDVAIASRYAPGAYVPIQQPLERRIASRVFNLYVRLMFGLPYSDTQCGAKVFRLSQVVPMLPDLKLKKYSFDVEMLWRLKKQGASIVEVPIVWEDHAGGDFKLRQSGVQSAIELAKLKFGIY